MLSLFLAQHHDNQRHLPQPGGHERCLGEGANNPASTPTAAEPSAMKMPGIVSENQGANYPCQHDEPEPANDHAVNPGIALNGSSVPEGSAGVGLRVITSSVSTAAVDM
jgi:hypothetical protein